MYERFTDNARKLMYLANQHAQILEHDHIGTEHLLLGLAELNSGVAVTALKFMGIEVNEIATKVQSRITPATEPPSTSRLRQSTQVKHVIEFALNDAARPLGHRYVGTEHLVLGLLDDKDCVAFEVLRDLSVAPATFRTKVLEILDSPEYRARNEECARRCDAWTRWPSIFSLFRRKPV